VTAPLDPSSAPRWRVAVTRDEPAGGPLARALEAAGFIAVPCPILVAQPPPDPGALARVAGGLDAFDWVVVASARAVTALAGARGGRWPAGVRTAAVGPRTAEALRTLGAWPPPLVGAADGAESLWARMREADTWPGRRVLVATTPGGREFLADALRDAGAAVEELDAYRMAPRPMAAIAADWTAAAPDAAVVASPRVAATLIMAVGTTTLARLRALVAIGPTTAAALTRAEVGCAVADRADFGEVARTLADLRDAGGRR
jgi:uroporphyrinogen-III synthase